MNLLILHGPNLNLLGEREPEIYGQATLKDINRLLRKVSCAQGVVLKIYQSNSEGRLIDLIQINRKWAQGIVINPAAYTHYSYAIRDAIALAALPTVEVHLTDIKQREAFRRVSVIEEVCQKQISGLGYRSYEEGIRYLIGSLK